MSRYLRRYIIKAFIPVEKPVLYVLSLFIFVLSSAQRSCRPMSVVPGEREDVFALGGRDLVTQPIFPCGSTEEQMCDMYGTLPIGSP